MLQQHHNLPDSHQNAWQLASIQLVGMISLPVLASSVLLLKFNNFYSSLFTILLGNIIIFAVRLAIIAVSHTKRENTIDISRTFMGKTGSYFIAILLLLSSLVWFIVQTTQASQSLTYLMPLSLRPDTNTFIQISVLLGVVSTLFCIEGMEILRRLATFSLPIIVLSLLVILVTAPPIHFPKFSYEFSFTGLAIVIATNLGFSVDLPTFFRHSRSWRSSLIGLIVIQICNLLVGFVGLYLGAILSPSTGLLEKTDLFAGSFALRSGLITLIFFSAICANVVNVYSASVGWELVVPKLAGRREYLILGFGMTVLFILFSNVFSLHSTLNSLDTALVNLCMILVIAYVIQLLVRRSPTSYEKIVYFIAWLVACFVNLIQVLGFYRFDDSTIVSGLFMIFSVILLGYSAKMMAFIFKK